MKKKRPTRRVRYRQLADQAAWAGSGSLGRQIPGEWDGCPTQWLFLWKLAEKGQRGAVVEEKDLYADGKADSTLGTVFYRLKRRVPASLWKHIVSNRSPRGYRLELERHQIHLF